MPFTNKKKLAPVELPSQLSQELRDYMDQIGKPVTVKAGTTLFHPGQEMESFLIVGKGLLRVFKASEAGREITLYYVGNGQCCTLNILCLLTRRPSPATALIEDDVTALAFPGKDFLSWFTRYQSMRDFVLGQMADRVHHMMTLVEEVAFQKLDQRLAAYLLAVDEDKSGLDISLTHETIAHDLGSVREVISRLLKNFENSNLISLGRGRISICNRNGLAEFSSQ